MELTEAISELEAKGLLLASDLQNFRDLNDDARDLLTAFAFLGGVELPDTFLNILPTTEIVELRRRNHGDSGSRDGAGLHRYRQTLLRISDTRVLRSHLDQGWARWKQDLIARSSTTTTHSIRGRPCQMGPPSNATRVPRLSHRSVVGPWIVSLCETCLIIVMVTDVFVGTLIWGPHCFHNSKLFLSQSKRMRRYSADYPTRSSEW
jgi:hypothetical protein